MPFVKVKDTVFEKVEILSKQIPDKSAKDFVHEALNFYFVYLDFLVNEKHSVNVLEDLKKQEDKEQANKDADVLILTMFRFFADKAFEKYLETKKELGTKIIDLSVFLQE
jgi:hypothetical protein